MIDRTLSLIRSVSVHCVGNPNHGEPLEYSDAPLDLANDKITALLKTYFLSQFKTPEFFSFVPSSQDRTENILKQLAAEIFQDAGSFHRNSQTIASHLYNATVHPNIKPGDLFVTLLTVAIDGTQAEALGIFKSENKDAYLKLKRYANQSDLFFDEGINPNKLDKGCLILNIEQDAGYKILLVDNANATEAQFWRNGFLQVEPWSDAFYHTHNVMKMTREYVERIPDEFSVSRADQIDLLNRSMNYFKSKDQFNKSEFETEVLADPDVIQSFRNYGKHFINTHELDPLDNFEISSSAVKQQGRVFKSVLKLDKNFHIYIHGNRDLIKKGFDEGAGKHYYMIYFDQES